MAPLALDQVHQYQRLPGTLEVRLVRTNPYVRITNGGEPPLFVQGGVIYSEGGDVITDPPAWWAAEVLKLSPTVRAEVGLGPVPVTQPAPATPVAAQKPVSPAWTCEQCGKTLTVKGRAFHLLHHKKEAPRGDASG
jgi:hypothetical protein